MLRAVIFDMDGLLLDSEPLWVRAEREVFGAVGVTLSEEDCAKTKGLRVDDVVAYWHGLHCGAVRSSEPRPALRPRRCGRAFAGARDRGAAAAGLTASVLFSHEHVGGCGARSFA